jgi:hypothetical protein
LPFQAISSISAIGDSAVGDSFSENTQSHQVTKQGQERTGLTTESHGGQKKQSLFVITRSKDPTNL